MVKNLSKILMISMLCLIGQHLFSQVSLIVSEETVTVEDSQVTVDVTVRNFIDVYGISFSMSYDTSVIKFSAITNINENLIELGLDQFGFPDGVNAVEEGQTIFGYVYQPGEQSLADDEVLFSIVYNVVGNGGDVGFVEINDDFAELEVYDDNFDLYEVVLDQGSVTITGVSEPDDLVITAGNETVLPGDDVCVSLSTDNFTEVIVGTGTILFDETVLEYKSISNIHPDLADAGFSTGIFSDANSASGDIRFSWSNDDDIDIVTLADDEVIFDICFEAIGTDGTMSPITLVETGGLPFTWYREIENNQNEEIPSSVVNGKVTIQSMIPDNITFIVADMNGTMDGNVCVPVTVENFDEIVTVEFAVDYDESILTYTGVDLGNNALAITSSNFNEDSDNYINMLWEGNGSGTDEPLTLADGTELFKLCFDVIGDCDSMGDIEIGKFDGHNFQVTQGSLDNEVDNLETVDGTITVVCGIDCEVVRIDTSCEGEETGNIIMNVTGENCDCVWTDENGNTVSTGTTPNCNLLAQAPGTYDLTVTCDGMVECTKSVVIEAFPTINVTGKVTDVHCNSKGSIVVTTSTPGDHTYEWVPSQNGTASISDLDAGSYTVTVTNDASGCSETMTFVVKEVDPLTLTEADITITPSSSNNGAITINPQGGTEPYSYVWSGAGGLPNSNTITGLVPGDYSVIVTDANGCEVEYTMITVSDNDTSIVIENLSGNRSLLCFGDVDGSITFDITNGDFPVSIVVAGPVSSTTEVSAVGEVEITDLEGGMYTLTLTDNGGNDVILDINITQPEVIVINSLINDCSEGDLCDGALEIEVEGGVSSYEYEWSNNDIIDEAGLDLCAGSYTVLITDSNGCNAMETFVVEDCSNPQGCFEGNKILSPNGDGIYDFFEISCINNAPSSLLVYDRWGQVVYDDASYSNDWGGTSESGELLNEGAYMWVLQVDFGNGTTRIEKGTVTLLRSK